MRFLPEQNKIDKINYIQRSPIFNYNNAIAKRDLVIASLTKIEIGI
ncbi:MAG: hypothetical protein HWQ35_11325 [Nostoc sp. NMS1]|nr:MULTISPECIES: hypothetical protein [unclassified Nostoc]MBN3907120.1 hypothetical protein [Nostoc sp. NMS1]MBN3989165.1 hypothetical protein [Nostoc sp. NMS2]